MKGVRDLNELVEALKALGEPEPEYRCAACQDTGLVEIDSGLEDGRRVKAPTAVPCTSFAHQKIRRPVEPAAERFS